MNGLEEIQEIIKNFIYEKQQMKHEIAEIESQRTQLAEKRNEKKLIKGNIEDAYTKAVEAEIIELGKNIAELGNQSQELQNKLDSKFISVKKQVNEQIDELIIQGIAKIRKIEDIRLELEEKIAEQENRNSKYEIQKKEFYSRYGRMPELSENAQKENKLQEAEYCENREKVLEVESQIKVLQGEIEELARNKREFRNENWNAIVENEKINEQEEVVEEIKQENLLQQETKTEEIATENVDEQIDNLIDIVENILEEQKNQEENNYEEIEEESIELPLVNFENENDEKNQVGQIEEIHAEEVKPIEEIHVEEVEPIEEMHVEEVEPIEEIHVEEVEPIEEIHVEEIEPIEEMHVEEAEKIEEMHVEEIEPIGEVEIEEIKVEEFRPIEEIDIEGFQPVEEINAEETELLEEVNIEEIEEIEQTENVEKETLNENIQEEPSIEDVIAKYENKIEEEIITAEENIIEDTEEKNKKVSFDKKVTLSYIIAKIEEGEVVYKAQLSNGKTIKVYPTRGDAENIILKDKENREELKEILINYAIAEYRTLDKKIIKKIDPIICEVLVRFAKEYNYDAQNLIYNYAMSFSKNEEAEIEAIPQITYNFSFMEDINLGKKEKEILTKICKNAKKNEKIEIIGYNTGFGKIKYILRRTFSINEANALPEGKF